MEDFGILIPFCAVFISSALSWFYVFALGHYFKRFIISCIHVLTLQTIIVLDWFVLYWSCSWFLFDRKSRDDHPQSVSSGLYCGYDCHHSGGSGSRHLGPWWDFWHSCILTWLIYCIYCILDKYLCCLFVCLTVTYLKTTEDTGLYNGKCCYLN